MAMAIIRKQTRVWGDMYGRTHKGWRLYLLGIPIWQRRRPVDRGAAKEQNSAEGNQNGALASGAILQDC